MKTGRAGDLIKVLAEPDAAVVGVVVQCLERGAVFTAGFTKTDGIKRRCHHRMFVPDSLCFIDVASNQMIPAVCLCAV